MSRFAAIIRKQFLMNYPEGREIQGVIREYQLNHQNQMHDQYIQDVYHDAECIMIICFFKSQAQALLQLSSFEVDMTFSRIATKGLNEIVFAAYFADQGGKGIINTFKIQI